MARRKDDSFINVFSAIFSRTSPWLCLPAAVIGFVLVAGVVTGVAASNPMLKGLAPLGLLFGGGVALLILLAGFQAAMERWSRRTLLAKQSGIESIRALSWSQFELLVGEAYRQQGFTVQETGQGGRDGGIDLKLRRGGEIILVQCKQWKSWKVGVGPIREIYGVLMAERAHRAIFITSGEYTADARAFAAGKPLELIDGQGLFRLIPSTASTVAPPPPPPPLTTSTPPACPKCSSEMVLRTAKKGANAGGRFWGCVTYPKCRGTAVA